MQATRPRESNHPFPLQRRGATTHPKRRHSNDYEARVGRSYWDIFRDNVLNLFNLVLGTLLVIVIGLGDYATAFFARLQRRQPTPSSACCRSSTPSASSTNWRRWPSRACAAAAMDNGGMSPMREVVKDEIIFIQPGDRLVVDGIVLQADSLEVDESQLTGESDAIAKSPDDRVLSGSFCTAGTGIMRATEVGEHSQIKPPVPPSPASTSCPKRQRKSKSTSRSRVAVLLMLVFVPLIFITGQLARQRLPGSCAQRGRLHHHASFRRGLVLVAILSLTIGAVKISMQQTLIQRG